MSNINDTTISDEEFEPLPQSPVDEREPVVHTPVVAHRRVRPVPGSSERDSPVVQRIPVARVSSSVDLLQVDSAAEADVSVQPPKRARAPRKPKDADAADKPKPPRTKKKADVPAKPRAPRTKKPDDPLKPRAPRRKKDAPAPAAADSGGLPIVSAVLAAAGAHDDVPVIYGVLAAGDAETQVAPPDLRPASPFQADSGAGDTQVLPAAKSRSPTPVLAEGGVGGSYLVIPPAGSKKKGMCAVCGDNVWDSQLRFKNQLGYVHKDCVLGPCCGCKEFIPVDSTAHFTTHNGKLAHTACDTVLANCHKCKGPIKLYSEGRLGDKDGNYYHAACGTAAPTLGRCTACKKWVTVAEGGVKCDDKLYHNGCAPPR